MLRLEEEQGHDPQKKTMIYHRNKAKKKSKVIAEREIRHLFWQTSILTAIISQGTVPDASSKVAPEMTFSPLPTLASARHLRIIFNSESYSVTSAGFVVTLFHAQPFSLKPTKNIILVWLTVHFPSNQMKQWFIFIPRFSLSSVYYLQIHSLITRDKRRRELKKKGAEIFHARSPTFDSTVSQEESLWPS